MKKIIISIIVVISFVNVSQSQIKVLSSGFINMLSTYNGYFILDNNGYYNGPALYPSNSAVARLGISNKYFYEMHSITFVTHSDKRSKENIKRITNSLNIIKELQGVKYDFKKESVVGSYMNPDKKIDNHLKNQLGLLAQDVQKVLPEVVIYDDSLDLYGIDYSKIVPVLIEAMKEQQSQIDSLKKLISKPKSTLKSAVVSTQDNQTAINNVANENEVASIDQNAPNPFNQSTLIDYYLPETTKDAKLYIFDMNGLQIKSIPIFTKGNGSVAINGSELNAGMYLYTLIVDGQEIDTKRMILTK